MNVVIRRASEADAELLSALNAEVQAIHANALPWWFKPPGEASFPPDRAAALMASPDNVVLVAELDSAPVGYAYAEIIRQPETPWRYGYEMMYLHQLVCAVSKGSAAHWLKPCVPRPSRPISGFSPLTFGRSVTTRVRSSGLRFCGL